MAFCVTGCKDKDGIPSGILGKDKMGSVLWDVLQANQLTAEYAKRRLLKEPYVENAQLQKQIFDQHQVTREEFYNSYAYYKNHPELMGTMIDSMINRHEATGKALWKGQQPKSPLLQQHQSIFKPHGQSPFKR
jgi:hypothetical protein